MEQSARTCRAVLLLLGESWELVRLADVHHRQTLEPPRRPSITATVRFFNLLKIEKLLLGGMNEVPVTKSAAAGKEKDYTDEELGAMIKALAQVRHGLPPQPHSKR